MGIHFKDAHSNILFSDLKKLIKYESNPKEKNNNEHEKKDLPQATNSNAVARLYDSHTISSINKANNKLSNVVPTKIRSNSNIGTSRKNSGQSLESTNIKAKKSSDKDKENEPIPNNLPIAEVTNEPKTKLKHQLNAKPVNPTSKMCKF